MKRRILSHFLMIIAAAVVLMSVLMILLTYGMLEQRVMEDLRVDARVLSAMIGSDTERMLANELSDDLRLTLIDEDGAVEFDNHADSSVMDSHADRPEVLKARETGEGRDIRNSKTVEKNTFYYALRLPDGRILRVAKEASSLLSVYLRAAPLILLVMAMMIGLSAAAADVLVRRLLEPIRTMTKDLAHADESGQYPELRPVLRMIRTQHEEILRNADMRVEFTANVSHELKTPLTSISGYAELIESGMAADDQAKRFAGEIHKSANRLLDLITDIIRLSQMDAQEEKMDFEYVDLAETARTVLEQLEPGAKKMDVTLTLDVQEAVVFADRQMMEELIFNLCDNAIRYNVRGGSVCVRICSLRNSVILTVQDTGIGIGKENQERVFERFYRVDKSRSKATGGTGLGLAIVKHIAAKHHAAIEMQSELGSGTMISVTFTGKA